MYRVGLSHVKFAPHSNHHAVNFLRQQSFLKDIDKQLNDATQAANVCSMLDKLRNIITEPKYVRFHSALDVTKQTALFTTWR